MIRYSSIKLGELTAYNTDGSSYKVQIRQGNCLAVFITVSKQDDGKWLHTLWSFYADESHLKNIEKAHDGNPFCYGDVRNIKLNVAYKESITLLKHFTKAGYKVTAYYKEEKSK